MHLKIAAKVHVDPCANDTAVTRRPPSSFATDLAWIAFWSVLLGTILTAPQWLWMLNHWDDPMTPIPVGTVQRVQFIGNLGIDSQIDTEVNSFLVRGATQFKKGVRLEQRKTVGSLLLCDADAQPEHCETRMGYR
jgi:hypothetical protein